MSLLRVEGFSVRQGGFEVVHGANLSAEPGEVVALLGPNGSGKSSLLRGLMGVVHAEGEAWLDGHVITGLTVRERITRGLVLCPDRQSVFGDMSVEENLLMGAYLRRDTQRVRVDIATLREAVGPLADRWQTRAGLLSGGEQRILGVAKALVARPRCLLVDEPTAGLGPGVRAPLASLLQAAISSAAAAVVLAEQSLDFALQMGAGVLTMRDGFITDRFKSLELRTNPVQRALVESLT